MPYLEYNSLVGEMTNQILKDFLRVTRALSDSTRLRIIMALRKRELCLCHLVELLGLAPSTVSKHLSILKEAGFVAERKKGKFVFNRIDSEGDSPIGREILRLAIRNLEKDKAIKADEVALKRILKLELKKLLEMQAKR